MRFLNGTPRGAAPRRREGFTIVEVIVAIVLLAAGVIALASSSALVLRTMNSSKVRSLAVSVASDRLEMLRSYDRCAQITSNTASTRGITEKWVPGTPEGSGMNRRVRVQYTATYTNRGVTRADTIYTWIPCT